MKRHTDTAELPQVPRRPPFAIRQHAYPGESHCGDDGGFWLTDRGAVLVVADGHGRGARAARTARAAVDHVSRHLGEPLPELLAGCHAALNGTEGAAVGVAVIDGDQLSYGGIGTTRALKVGAQSCTFSNGAGLVGVGFGALLVEVVPIERSDLVVLFTDGVSERLRVPASVSVGPIDVGAAASDLLELWSTQREDALILVYQHPGAG